MSADLRQDPRFDSELPVQIQGTPGHTRNLSAAGIYFETDLQQEVGSPIKFTVEFSLGGKRQTLACAGTVVRVERLDGRIGVAARMDSPLLEQEEAHPIPQ